MFRLLLALSGVPNLYSIGYAHVRRAGGKQNGISIESYAEQVADGGIGKFVNNPIARKSVTFISSEQK